MIGTVPIRPDDLTNKVMSRFWAKVNKVGPDGCWLWTAGNRRGYGAFRFGRRMVASYRISWVAANGPIPDGLTLDHLCRVPACVNPDHLEPVTQAENTRRASGFAYGTCRRGHDLLTLDAVFVYSNGERSCRECMRVRQREYRAKAREER